MTRTFTVQKGLFVGGWGDHDSIRVLQVHEHCDLTLAEIKKDYPFFYGAQSKLACRWQAHLISSWPFGYQRRRIDLVSGGTPPQGGGVIDAISVAIE